MKDRKILIWLGIALIIVQIISLVGMSKVPVGLYPTCKDVGSWYGSEDCTLNLSILSFAIEAGSDRFSSSFEDLTFSENDYRVPSARQFASAMLRDGMKDNDNLGLFIYDVVLSVSYAFCGICGLVLIIIEYFLARKDEQKELSNTIKEEMQYVCENCHKQTDDIVMEEIKTNFGIAYRKMCRECSNRKK